MAMLLVEAVMYVGSEHEFEASMVSRCVQTERRMRTTWQQSLSWQMRGHTHVKHLLTYVPILAAWDIPPNGTRNNSIFHSGNG